MFLMNRPLTAYLAGAIESLSDEGRAWREKYRDTLSNINIKGLIPNDLNNERELPHEEWQWLREHDPVEFRDKFRELIMKPDLKMVRDADFVIIKYEGERTSGTHAEATLAWEEGKLVFLVSSLPRKKIPMWLLATTSFEVASLDELVDLLLEVFADSEKEDDKWNIKWPSA